MNKFIAEKIEDVNSAFPSIYTKQDVTDLLTSLNESMKSEPAPDAIHITERAVQNLIEEVVGICQRYLDDWNPSDNVDQVELTLNYDNRIEVESITVDVDDLLSNVVYDINASAFLNQLISDSKNE